MSKEFSRRAVVLGIAGGLIAACAPSIILERPGTQNPETLRITPQMGDILRYDNSSFLLRREKLFPIGDFETYRRRTEVDKYGRKVFQLNSSADLTRYINQYPVGSVPENQQFVDTYTGDFKDSKLEGGVMNVLFGGLLTSQDSLIHYINPKESLFSPLTDRLKQGNWDDPDFCYFTYGEEKKTDFKAEYDALDTARSIEENEKYAVKQIEKIMDYSPLIQFNLIGHSLGGVFALAAARKYPDIVNNLICLSSPIRGMDSNPIRLAVVSFVRDRYIKPIAGDEKVSGELVRRWKDPDFLKKLDQFALDFSKRGGKIGIALSKDDPIVLPEYARLPGASEIEVSAGGGNILDFITKPIEAVRAHGRTIDNQQVLDFESGLIGRKAA